MSWKWRNGNEGLGDNEEEEKTVGERVLMNAEELAPEKNSSEEEDEIKENGMGAWEQGALIRLLFSQEVAGQEREMENEREKTSAKR